MKPIDKVLPRLTGVRRSGQGWQALCPVHDDKRPSLKIDEGDDGKILLKCWAGCKTEDVVTALGLTMSDLFPTRPSHTHSIRPKKTRQAPKPTYIYGDTSGKPLFGVIRTQDKRFFQVRPDGNGDWLYGLDGIKPVPYQLPEVTRAVRAGETIYIPEGEKDADNLAALGLAATTNPMGAGKWRDSYSKHFAGAKVVILPDNDGAGRKHAEHVANSLHGVAASVRVLELPDLPEKGDVSDWLANGGTKAELLRLASEAPWWEPPRQHKVDTNEQERPTQSQILISLASDAELFHTPEDEAYATIPVGGHKETWPLRNRGFRRWLLRHFYESEEKAPGAQALQDALGVLGAKAFFDGPELPVFIRLAELGGNIYLDLCNEAWEVVEVTPEGWQVIDNSPVKFRRAKGMLPLPKPDEGGSIEDLRPFVNVPNDQDWRLLVAWLVAAMRPSGPYPVLVLHGEQGSAKSTTAKILRSLVDPNIAPLRTAPREERDLAIAANNSWVLSFDNLSGVPLWLSDALCRVATGGGFATRRLYEDDEEVIFDYVRPIAANGISDIVTRHDLLDRSLIVTLPVISEDKRQCEHSFWAEFERVRPRILGAFLDAVAIGLAYWPVTNLDKLPRMADFAKWIVACEPALPWESGGFMESYDQGRADAVSQALETDCVAVAVRDLIEERESFEGTATELLNTLEDYVPEKTQKTRAWPKNARTLGNRIRRAATFLRQTGIEVATGIREGNTGRRLIRISNESIVTNDTIVTEKEEPLLDEPFHGDATVTLVTQQ